MKKFLMKPLTLLLVLALAIVPMTAYASDAPFGFEDDTNSADYRTRTVTGKNTTLNPVMSVIVPLSLDFILDPFSLDLNSDLEWQVAKTDMYVVNYMPANVVVDVEITATAADDVKFVDTADELDKNSTGAAEKAILFGVIGANDATLTEGTTMILGTEGVDHNLYTTSGVDPINDRETADPVSVVYPVASEAIFSLKDAFEYVEEDGLISYFPAAENGEETKTKIRFALEKAYGGNAANDPELPQVSLAENNKGISSFMFYADLNTQAPWADGDITVSGKYRLWPLPDNEFVDPTLEWKGDETVGLNVSPSAAAVTPDITIAAGGNSGSTTIARSKYPDPGLFVLLQDKPASITEVKGGSTVYDPDTEYSYNPSTGILNITRAGANSPSTVVIQGGGNTYTLTLTITG
jgi:hypothetical protein